MLLRSAAAGRRTWRRLSRRPRSRHAGEDALQPALLVTVAGLSYHTSSKSAYMQPYCYSNLVLDSAKQTLMASYKQGWQDSSYCRSCNDCTTGLVSYFSGRGAGHVSCVCREAARATMMADTVGDDDLAAVEDAFFKAAGLTESQGLQFLAKRRAAASQPEEAEPQAEQQLEAAAVAADG